MNTRFLRTFSAFAFASLFATSAHAHHAMDGQTPTTLYEGLVSGLAHPVIGLDHLAFILAAGLFAAVAGMSLFAPLLFVAGSLVGVGLHLMLLDLPAAEIVIPASVLAGGWLLARGRAVESHMLVFALFLVVGVFHGYAFGEAIVGSEQTPLIAYLAGLAAIQSAIALGVYFLVRSRGWAVEAMQPRLAGAAIVGVGITFLAGQLLG
ncbi:HupE/UreJ family protein [Nitratireductor aquimarinus]|uniref:HupE/UreJ family protein n=1 Tax=Nitratireductor aquimarinus TaxID=889300 RepID=UPI0029360361|nr:HupE/UreJ family protein [Nitratireductor aquimarinus]MDV2965794.1 HupE/UreJ family protein [Nitratireductor aquimarinus]